MTKRPVLVRIPFSHFCRKAEWGLTQAGIPYDTLDVSLRGMLHIHRANPEGTVPFLVHDGKRLSGSERILAWAEQRATAGALPLYPRPHGKRIREWEAWAGEELGPVSRREAYRVAFNDPGHLTDKRWVHVVARLGRRQILGVLRFYKVRRFDAHDRAAVPLLVQRIGDRIEANGTGYLFGHTPTAADIATAALFEPLTYAAPGRDYIMLAGWEPCVAHLQRVRPAKVLRARRRRMRERHWRWLGSIGA